MRIIAGKARGRLLEAPQGSQTRPTADRVREALFSMIDARLDFEGIEVLDLFAGSGALSLEALSRGATRAVLIEHAQPAIQAIEQNAAHLGLADRCTVMRTSVSRALRRLKRDGAHFDLILADPPYVMDPWGLLKDLPPLTRPHGLMVIEHAAKQAAPSDHPQAELRIRRCYGDTGLAVFGLRHDGG